MRIVLKASSPVEMVKNFLDSTGTAFNLSYSYIAQLTEERWMHRLFNIAKNFFSSVLPRELQDKL